MRRGRSSGFSGVVLVVACNSRRKTRHASVCCVRSPERLRCHTCHRGYFAAGAPSPQPCQACTGGRLLPVGLWDLAHEAAPPGMLSRKEVHRAHVG